MSCDHGVDPVFFRAFMRNQRLKERNQEYKDKMREGLMGKTMEQVEYWLWSEGELPSSPSSLESEVTPLKQSVQDEIPVLAEHKGKRKLFIRTEECESDPLPPKFRHLRTSERKVKDDYYRTCEALSGEGLSLQECTTAVVTVGNEMFGRKWKKASDKEDSFDIDTAPDKINLLEKLRHIEAQSLCMVAEKMQEGMEMGDMVTNASDSTINREG